jgi:hypothetical protein
MLHPMAHSCDFVWDVQNYSWWETRHAPSFHDLCVTVAVGQGIPRLSVPVVMAIAEGRARAVPMNRDFFAVLCPRAESLFTKVFIVATATLSSVVARRWRFAKYFLFGPAQHRLQAVEFNPIPVFKARF